MFTRTIEITMKGKFNSGKAIIVIGARQVGKIRAFSYVNKVSLSSKSDHSNA
ncbi:MAG: hypothetical protein HOD63_13925 [Bacteroidetes bacterium]|jgi:hypothetical protein|nr:hypothetical protein [Bacteroidota bacterium]MBT5528149.1 hypothetical protein [Cytophagia bacterium]MBT4339687.1 hypothetical protein [Bacteroidota bacterium]MBT4970545.1 hypothetical protein [Bacteroidota bacterium]MBT5990619.1 hypothetical protein [Bacteroidota bacterium]